MKNLLVIREIQNKITFHHQRGIKTKKTNNNWSWFTGGKINLYTFWRAICQYLYKSLKTSKIFWQTIQLMGIYLIEIIKDRSKELAASIVCKRKFGKNLTSIMRDLLNKTAASAQQITMQPLQSVSSICIVLKMLLKYCPGKKAR